MQPYKWTFKEDATGDLYYLLHIYTRNDGVLIIRKKNGGLLNVSIDQFGRDYVFVEEAT